MKPRRSKKPSNEKLALLLIKLELVKTVLEIIKELLSL